MLYVVLGSIGTSVGHNNHKIETYTVDTTSHSIWLKRELPTIDRILFDVNEDPSLPNYKRTCLYHVIKNWISYLRKEKSAVC